VGTSVSPVQPGKTQQVPVSTAAWTPSRKGGADTLVRRATVTKKRVTVVIKAN